MPKKQNNMRKRTGRANALFPFFRKAAAQQLPEADDREKQGEHLAQPGVSQHPGGKDTAGRSQQTADHGGKQLVGLQQTAFSVKVQGKRCHRKKKEKFIYCTCSKYRIQNSK